MIARKAASLGLVTAIVVLLLGASLGSAAPLRANPYTPPVIPDAETSFVLVEIAANPGEGAVTFAMRVWGADLPGQHYEIWAPVPLGTQVLDTWAAEPGLNPASVSEGQVKWQLAVPGGWRDPKARLISAPYVFVVSWDGQSALRTRAHVTTRFGPNQGLLYHSGDNFWIDDNGQRHWESTSEEIGVGNPTVPTASSFRLRIRSLEKRISTLEERLRAIEEKR